MGRCKEQVIEATGGLFANPIEKEIRGRIFELRELGQTRNLTKAEIIELGSLLHRLPDDDEDDYRYLDKD